MHVLSSSVTIFSNREVLFVEVEAFEGFSETFDSSGFKQLFCWHTRENWTNISICAYGFLLMTLLYVVFLFGNIRSPRENDIASTKLVNLGMMKNTTEFSRRYRSSDNLQTREARSFVAIKLTSHCGFILQIVRARNFYKVLVKKTKSTSRNLY